LRTAVEILEEAKLRGFLGPGPVELHRRHSLGFADALAPSRLATEAESECHRFSGRILDLGSGGGIPGVVLAELWPEAQLTLLDSSERRCEFLEEQVSEAGWSDRVGVACGRAEELGRRPELRGAFDSVLSRSFGRPAVTAECGAPFLKVLGLLVVSDPPRESGQHPEPGIRWPESDLAILGLELLRTVDEPFHFTVLRASEPCPERYSRRTGIPAKRPLF
jgi:16S rRNA (guanine527-N7)-methyltransferase